MNVVCPHCQSECQLVTGAVIYPHREDLHKKQFYLCRPCLAYVGCHSDGTGDPLGTPANAELRALRIKAHALFDPLWKEYGWGRGKAYEWLAAKLEIPVANCHIGMTDVPLCQRIIEVCEEFHREEAVQPGNRDVAHHAQGVQQVRFDARGR